MNIGGSEYEYVELGRALWAQVLLAFDSNDPQFRERVYDEVLQLAPEHWDEYLEREEAAAKARQHLAVVPPPGRQDDPPRMPPAG